MKIDSILAELDAEIARLTEARSLLSGLRSAPTDGTKGKAPAKAPAKATKKAAKKRTLSVEARKRIADAQRKRWAALRAKAKAK